MARTLLTASRIVKEGLVEVVGTAGIVDGHKFRNSGRTFVRVAKHSTSGAVTFQTPKAISGLAIAELAVSFDPTLNLSFDQVWQVVEGGAFVDETADANSATDNDWLLFPVAEVTTDYAAFGHQVPFSEAIFDNLNGVQGVGGVIAWEYWNGAWTAVVDLSDGTTGFTAAVADGQSVTHTPQSDWIPMSLNNSAPLYWLRARITTVFGTNPVYDQGFITGAATQLIGPFEPNLFNQIDGLVYVDYEGSEEGEFTIWVFNL